MTYLLAFFRFQPSIYAATNSMTPEAPSPMLLVVLTFFWQILAVGVPSFS